MKLSLVYDFACTPQRFWELYYDPAFTERLHREALGSTSIEIVETTGDLATGLTRTLRYGQRPDAPGPVKRLFGDEIVSVEVTTFDPATSTATLVLTPGTLGDKTDIRGTIAIAPGEDPGTCRETFSLEGRVRIFGAGPVVERFIDHQARGAQDKAVAFIRRALEGA